MLKKIGNFYWKKMTIPGRMGMDCKSYMVGGIVGVAVGIWAHKKHLEIEKQVERERKEWEEKYGDFTKFVLSEEYKKQIETEKKKEEMKKKAQELVGKEMEKINEKWRNYMKEKGVI